MTEDRKVALPIPDRCLLAQAALWFAENVAPIPDEIFAREPSSACLYEHEVKNFFRSIQTDDFEIRGDIFSKRVSVRMLRQGKTVEPQIVARNVSVPIKQIFMNSIDPISWNIQISNDLAWDIIGSIKDVGWYSGGTDAQEFYFSNNTINFKRYQLHLVGRQKLQNIKAEGPFSEFAELPYIAFMLNAVAALDLTSGKKVPKDHIRNWIRENWPNDLGPSSGKKIEYLATFLRRPKDERGGYIK